MEVLKDRDPVPAPDTAWSRDHVQNKLHAVAVTRDAFTFTPGSHGEDEVSEELR
jgi:hypothetical protein